LRHLLRRSSGRSLPWCPPKSTRPTEGKRLGRELARRSRRFVTILCIPGIGRSRHVLWELEELAGMIAVGRGGGVPDGGRLGAAGRRSARSS